ncbi:MAG TPA: hypothetical protein ENK52_03830 [Saprospiraceae bacterium]|nr:hypothetical protein [Saprospiraceae bacterium]
MIYYEGYKPSCAAIRSIWTGRFSEKSKQAVERIVDAIVAVAAVVFFKKFNIIITTASKKDSRR